MIKAKNSFLTPVVLSEIIRRIVKIAHPEKIILFGSAVRRQMNRHSDLDLLVIKKGPIHRGRLTENIYMNLLGIDQAVDIIVITPEDIQKYGKSSCLVLEPALREGKVIYEKAKIPTG